MWEQSWVVQAPSGETAVSQVRSALLTWAPDKGGAPELGLARPYRGPDDLALAEDMARDLAEIRQTVAQSHRKELARRLADLSHRALGIPPRPGFVILDDTTPRSPRPGDLRAQGGVRWVVMVRWNGDPPK